MPGTVKAFGYALSGVEALAIYLMRLSTLGGNGEIGLIFKRPACCISMCASTLSSDLFWGKLEKIASMDHDWLNYSNLSEWGQALVAERYFPLSTIAGFVGVSDLIFHSIFIILSSTLLFRWKVYKVLSTNSGSKALVLLSSCRPRFQIPDHNLGECKRNLLKFIE